MPSHSKRRLLCAFGLSLLIPVAALPFVAISSFPATAAEKPVAPEKNPPGDIPDNQVFVDYKGPFGTYIKVPEGWARTDLSNGASFVDKYNGVVLTVTDAAQAPTVESIKDQYLDELAKERRAVRVASVKPVKLPSGPAISIQYSSNSEPNPVTNKQIRLENARFLYFKDGKLATLDMYAPYGADNVDQWKMMSESFGWK